MHFRAFWGDLGLSLGCHRGQSYYKRKSYQISYSGAMNQKNPRAHKNKIGTPPPPKPKIPPPLKRGILWTQVFLQKERIFPGVHKIGAAISGPRIADTNFTDTRIFLNEFPILVTKALFLGGPSWGVHADLVTSEIFQCEEFSLNCLSVNCLLISVKCLLNSC